MSSLVTQETLGRIQATAKDAFEVADLNHDGRLSFDEFQKWYKKSGAGGESEEKLETPSARRPSR